jgi:hypothetical protein
MGINGTVKILGFAKGFAKEKFAKLWSLQCWL